MARPITTYLPFLYLLFLAYSEDFQRFKIKNGIATIPRHLDVENDQTSVNFQTIPSVRVNVGKDYNKVLFTEKPSLGPQVDFSTRYQMLIFIPTNETVFIDASFENQGYLGYGYYCDSPLCSPSSNDSFKFQTYSFEVDRITRIQFNKSTYNITNPPLSIINGSWQLNSEALLAPSFNQRNIGWIGLGTEGDAYKNFMTPGNPIFSFSLKISANSPDYEGEIIFGADPNKTSSPIVTLNTDGQWKMNLSSLSYGSFNYNSSNQTILTMDVQVNSILLSRDVYNAFQTELQKNTNIRCYSDGYSLTCTISGKHSPKLPELVLQLADGSQLSIPYQAYWNCASSNLIYVSCSMKIASWDTSNLGVNYIVLGQSIMAYFYSVFEATESGNTITFYQLPFNNTVFDDTSDNDDSNANSGSDVNTPPNNAGESPSNVNPPSTNTGESPSDVNPPSKNSSESPNNVNPPSNNTSESPSNTGTTGNEGDNNELVLNIVRGVIILGVIVCCCCLRAYMKKRNRLGLDNNEVLPEDEEHKRIMNTSLF